MSSVVCPGHVKIGVDGRIRHGIWSSSGRGLRLTLPDCVDEFTLTRGSCFPKKWQLSGGLLTELMWNVFLKSC